RGDFELVVVSEELCRRFSKRDAQIDAALDALLKERPDLAHGNFKALRQRLATSE
ncbi:MAG: relaxase domain-containing protein, partial [Verrucomicrobiales bacterium]|nr:relaxase domain-containing protein [Verrucomicrobiales bacterium]